MLLDRRKVKFWQKIVFSLMALLMVVFAIGISGMQWLGCGGNEAQSATETLDQEITKFKTVTASDPSEVNGWIKLAEAFLSRSSVQQRDSTAQKADLRMAAAAYAKAEKLLAKQKGPGIKTQHVDVLTQLAGVYGALGDEASAARVYRDITALRPKDPQAFFNLGSAAIAAGDTRTALLALNRFLELDPESPDAPAVKDWIEANTPGATPTPSPSATE